MKPYYEHAGIAIYHGDCRDVLPCVTADAVVSDPPYGMRRHGRFGVGSNGDGKPRRARTYGEMIVGDEASFDPTPWLGFSEVILWGANHYVGLPIGTTLVWVKRFDPAFGSYLSDAEVAWMKGGHGVYCFRETGYKANEERYHPTQKPLALMRWCVGKTSGTILDPFMGSGTTLRAAKDARRFAIGIEIEERYCEIAAQRLSQEVLNLGDVA